MDQRTDIAIVAGVVAIETTIACGTIISTITQTSFSSALSSSYANAQQEKYNRQKVVQTHDIANGAITDPKLAASAITSNKIKNNKKEQVTRLFWQERKVI